MRMRHIKGLTRETLKMLDRIYKQSKYYQVRQRAHCIQLTSKGYKISELMKIFKVSRNTIYNWLNSWESSNLVGLYNQPGRGRKKTFNSVQEQRKDSGESDRFGSQSLHTCWKYYRVDKKIKLSKVRR